MELKLERGRERKQGNCLGHQKESHRNRKRVSIEEEGSWVGLKDTFIALEWSEVGWGGMERNRMGSNRMKCNRLEWN